MAAFTQAFDRLRQDCDRGHEGRIKLMRDIRRGAAVQAAETVRQLAEETRQRHAEFTSMMTALRNDIRTQAEHTCKQLADLAADLRSGGAVFHGRKT